MDKELEFTLDAEAAGSRLDRALALLIPGSSRSFLQKLIREGRVTADGETVTLPRLPVKPGMRIRLTIPETGDTAPAAEPFDFPILYEDAFMLAINKPAGVVVHPAAGNPDGTVVNALLGRYPGMAERFSEAQGRPGIVHRLDKDTSGCLVIAKTPDALFQLGKAFSEHRTHKTYLAISRGVPERASGELQSLIGRHPVNRQKMAVVERNGKLAVTKYRVLGTATIDNVPLALLEVNIATGRTHQIRVHLSGIRLPIVGDELYGRHNDFPGVTRQLLHAWKLSVPHPESGEQLELTAPVPPDLLSLARKIVPGFLTTQASDAGEEISDAPGSSTTSAAMPDACRRNGTN